MENKKNYNGGLAIFLMGERLSPSIYFGNTYHRCKSSQNADHTIAVTLQFDIPVLFSYFTAGQVASTPEHCGQCPEVSMAETQCSGCLFSVQPYGHHSGVCTKRGAPGCREDEEVSSQTGDCKQQIIADFRSTHCDKVENK